MEFGWEINIKEKIIMEILDKAIELGEMLEQTNEYVRYRNAEKARYSDESAVEAYEKYSKDRAILMLQMREEGTSQEQVEQIKKDIIECGEELKQNKIVLEFLQAQDEFSRLLTQINGIIKHFISDDKTAKECSSSKGCAGCAGCK
jgi:cell fate (sporulation/competence/biofilm development) regulator YlbF (YheA/YmcA/DUF963 family)